MAVPRITPRAGTDGIGLPQPLAPSEAARIRRIFALQRRDAIPDAVAETSRLSDTTLLGHILADRYLGLPARTGRVPAAALSDWLGRYADLPDACAIYALLLKQLPHGAVRPAAPPCAALGSAGQIGTADGATAASAARVSLIRGRDAKAEQLGRAAFTRSRGKDGEAAYVAGLAAWRQDKISAACSLFEAASLAENSSASVRAAAAYWAARAHLRQAERTLWRPWMMRAAAEPHTLHGMVAARALGLKMQAPPPSPTLGEADLDAIAATPQGLRAFALLQVGEPARAEAELRRLWPSTQGSPAMSRALFLVAGTAGLSDLVADLAGIVDATEADLPVPILRPRGGFLLNPALVYAVARVESNFDPAALSGAGARGLMQLTKLAVDAMGTPSARPMTEPGQNLRLGQQYLAYLSRPDVAGDDLLRVLASYNAGPSAVLHWEQQADPDPLMFLETIPTDETRHFVARTLTNLWGYAARFRQPSPSLDALSSGNWPHFSAELADPAVAPRRMLVSLH